MMRYILPLFLYFLPQFCVAQNAAAFSTIGMFTPLRGLSGYPLNGYTVELGDVNPYLGKTVRVTGEFSVLSTPQRYTDPQDERPNPPTTLTYLIKKPTVEILKEDITRFHKKLALATWLVKNQPEFDLMREQPVQGFHLNAANTFDYSLTDTEGNTVRVYLHRDTKQIVFVEIAENVSQKHAITTYLTETQKYSWIGSEHLCDYLNNSVYSVQICPRSEHGITIHVGLMNP